MCSSVLLRREFEISNEQYAFLSKSKVPTREAWQAAIEASDFDFQLDPELKPFENSGFLPCKMMGSDAGFEIYYDEVSNLPGEFRELAQGRDYCISFRRGGSMVECASAMIASYALAKSFDAIVSYEGEDPHTDLDDFLKQTNEVIDYAKKEL